MYYHVEGQGFTRVAPINANVSCIHKSPRLAVSRHPLVCFRSATSAFAVLRHNASACREGAQRHGGSLNCSPFQSQVSR